jgi:tetratricopeptide (TPR) repeat protein
MKHRLSLWLALAALTTLPLMAQDTLAKIHGHVQDPTGVAKASGTITLSQDGGKTALYTFPVSVAGDYKGEAKPGTYDVVYRQPDTPADKMADDIHNVKLVLGQDINQDVDMSRKEYLDAMTPEQRKQVEEFRKKNAEILKTNSVIKNLNADLQAARQSIKDKKYEEAEALMLKDTGLKPDAAILWIELAQSQVGLKKYDDAEVNFKKTIDLDKATPKQNLELEGGANSGLGEVYARTNKIPEATAAYDAAAKWNPTAGAQYLTNEAVIFYQLGNADAQAAAADAALKLDPSGRPILYYLKGNALVQKATIDPKTNMIVLPPGCTEALQQYLTLAPDGQFAKDVKDILAQAGQKITSGFGNKKK